MFPVLMEATLADISGLISQIKAGIVWLFSLFGTFVDTISSNDLLLYPVLLGIVIGVVGLVVTIVRKFGMRSRRS